MCKHLYTLGISHYALGVRESLPGYVRLCYSEGVCAVAVCSGLKVGGEESFEGGGRG